MSHVPHELAAEFPEFAQQIHDLKTTDAHFARCFDAYHVVNRQVHRSEINVEPVADKVMTDLRKERVALKDELYAILKHTSG